MERYVTVAIYTYPSEYTVLEHLLQQARVRYVFQNETMISVLPFHSNALGGIRLKVHPDDESTAQSIIEDLKSSDRLNIV